MLSVCSEQRARTTQLNEYEQSPRREKPYADTHLDCFSPAWYKIPVLCLRGHERESRRGGRSLFARPRICDADSTYILYAQTNTLTHLVP